MNPNNAISYLPKVGPEAWAIYCYLCSLDNGSGEVTPSYEMIQEGTGMARQTIAVHLQKLKASGLINMKRRFSASTVYSIVAISPQIRLAEPLTTTTINTYSSKSSISPEYRLMEEQPGEVTHFQLLSSAVVEFAHFQEFTGGERWIAAIDKMERAGVEPEDIKSAVELLTSKKYSIIGPWSLINTAIGEMGKRKRNSAKQEQPAEVFASEVY